MSKAGFVILSNKKEFSLHVFKTKLIRGVIQTGKIFPIRWREAHTCHFGANFYPLVESAMRALMSPFQRETFFVHNGTDDEVVEELSKYSFGIKCIPKELGE